MLFTVAVERRPMSTTERSGLSKRSTTIVLAGLALMLAGIAAPLGRILASLFLMGGAAILLVGLVVGLVLDGDGPGSGGE